MTAKPAIHSVGTLRLDGLHIYEDGAFTRFCVCLWRADGKERLVLGRFGVRAAAEIFLHDIKEALTVEVKEGKWKVGQRLANRYSGHVVELAGEFGVQQWKYREWDWVHMGWRDTDRVETFRDYVPWPRVGDWVRPLTSDIIESIKVTAIDNGHVRGIHPNSWFAIEDIQPACPKENL